MIGFFNPKFIKKEFFFSFWLAIRSGDYYMFDELDDDDVTDMIPDTESEKREAEKRRELEQRGRRMTISEVRRLL